MFMSVPFGWGSGLRVIKGEFHTRSIFRSKVCFYLNLHKSVSQTILTQLRAENLHRDIELLIYIELLPTLIVALVTHKIERKL